MGTVVGKGDGGLILERADGAKMRFDPRERGHFDVGLSRSLSVSAGEKLLVRANFAPCGLKNGDLATVQEVKSDGSLVLRDGRMIPNHFRQFTHGYASTSHAAQGKTVDHGILLMGEKGIKAANLKQAYVSNSRFRGSQAIFTVDKQTAFDSMATDSERQLALEVVKTNENEFQSHVQFQKRKDTKSESVKVSSLDWNVSPGQLKIRP
jgi:ATP-dependent exoDNAse (exonuclease V) alpha subunit